MFLPLVDEVVKEESKTVDSSVKKVMKDKVIQVLAEVELTGKLTRVYGGCFYEWHVGDEELDTYLGTLCGHKVKIIVVDQGE